MRLRPLASVLLLLPLAATAAAPGPMHSLEFFAGGWDCTGVFPASGRTIASRMDFRGDLDGAALVKHHADRPPAGYRALEAWAWNARERRFNATVLDNGGGARRMRSDGWRGDTLTWTVDADGGPKQQFVYVRKDRDTYRVDWKIERPGKGLVVGDTLTCRRR